MVVKLNPVVSNLMVLNLDFPPFLGAANQPDLISPNFYKLSPKIPSHFHFAQHVKSPLLSFVPPNQTSTDELCKKSQNICCSELLCRARVVWSNGSSKLEREKFWETILQWCLVRTAPILIPRKTSKVKHHRVQGCLSFLVVFSFKSSLYAWSQPI